MGAEMGIQEGKWFCIFLEAWGEDTWGPENLDPEKQRVCEACDSAAHSGPGRSPSLPLPPQHTPKSTFAGPDLVP